MISIVGNRGTGKTTKLIKYAAEHDMMILTTNSRALREKARSLGYKDVEIIGFGNLKNDDFSFGKKVLVDNAEYVLQTLLDKYYCLEMEGFTANIQNDHRK